MLFQLTVPISSHFSTEFLFHALTACRVPYNGRTNATPPGPNLLCRWSLLHAGAISPNGTCFSRVAAMLMSTSFASRGGVRGGGSARSFSPFGMKSLASRRHPLARFGRGILVDLDLLYEIQLLLPRHDAEFFSPALLSKTASISHRSFSSVASNLLLVLCSPSPCRRCSLSWTAGPSAVPESSSREFFSLGTISLVLHSLVSPSLLCSSAAFGVDPRILLSVAGGSWPSSHCWPRPPPSPWTCARQMSPSAGGTVECP